MALTAWADLQSWLPPFVGPSLVTLLAWTVLFVQFTGLGMLALRTVKRGAPHAESVLSCFWVGLAATLAWLQVWSLWLAVSWVALIVPTLVGGVGWVTAPHQIYGGLIQSRRWPVALGILALLVWATVAAQAPLDVYDAGTYHLSALRWAST